MSDQISQAFGHPIDRARALAGPEPRDRISLRDHVRAVEIGAFQSERGHTQHLRFNIVAEVRPNDRPEADDVDRVLSYDRLTEAIGAELTAERLNLLETLAERVFVRIEKLDRGPGALGVEIMRSREDAQPLGDGAQADPAPVPLLYHVPADLLAAPGLGGWMAGLAAAGRPVIVTCDAPDLPRPAAPTPEARDHIALLAQEQAAWALAALDDAASVVGSRTELDWLLKAGQLGVWAPSKMVLDAVGGPGAGAPARDLAAWLAGRLGAEPPVPVTARMLDGGGA